MGRGSIVGLVVAWFDGSLTTICVAWRFVDGLFAKDHDWWLIFPTPNSQPLSSIQWVCGGLVVEIVADRWWVSLEVWVILAWVSLAAWFKWWVLFGMGQVGYGVEIVIRRGGNRRGVVVAVENRHRAVCGSIVGSDGSPLVVFFFNFFFKRGFVFGLMIQWWCWDI